MYGVSTPSLHHYPHPGLTTNYGLSQAGLQRSSTLMYGGTSLYSPSDWGIHTGHTPASSGLLSRAEHHPAHHREYLSCAAAAAAAAASGSSPLGLGSHQAAGYSTTAGYHHPGMGGYGSGYDKIQQIPGCGPATNGLHHSSSLGIPGCDSPQKENTSSMNNHSDKSPGMLVFLKF